MEGRRQVVIDGGGRQRQRWRKREENVLFVCLGRLCEPL
jgi:hypothetical protein